MMILEYPMCRYVDTVIPLQIFCKSKTILKLKVFKEAKKVSLHFLLIFYTIHKDASI